MPGREAALEERIERMREILEKDPEDATLWFTLGRTLLELGRPDQAAPPLRRAIDQLAAERPTDGPTLLLAHNPETLEHASLHRFPLVLSGHTHGGQLALPFARNLNLALLMTSHTRGLYRQDDTTLYVNRGLGVGGPAIRVAATREIGVIELRCD